MSVESHLRARWNCPMVLQAAGSMEKWSKENEIWYKFCVFNTEDIFSARWSKTFVFSRVNLLHSYREHNVMPTPRTCRCMCYDAHHMHLRSSVNASIQKWVHFPSAVLFSLEATVGLSSMMWLSVSQRSQYKKLALWCALNRASFKSEASCLSVFASGENA